MKKRLFLSLIIFLLLTIAQTASAFIIKKIEIQGLQGISRDTILSYLPLKVGDRFDLSQSNEVIQKLYKTGFFENISLSKQENTLIVKVVQRPVIGRITITGNKTTSTKKLLEILRNIGFVEGQVFDQSILEKIKTSLSREYFTIGKYNAAIDTKVIKEARNRVTVKIIISEGKAAKIRQIKIIGNHSFHENELLDQFALSTSTPLSFITHNDRYSREKLAADLEALRSYYMDKGFIKFNIDSTQVSMSPNRSEVYITIHITEGSQYTLSGYTFSETSILSKKELEKLTKLKIGKTFSRQAIMNTNKRITDVLGDKGYSSADIDIIPKIDDEHKTVFVTFSIKPGQRIYIRKITFSDNYHTNDKVLRRELLQREGAILSKTKINISKRSLLLLPYIRDVQVNTTPVPGETDQVDLNFKVTEHSVAELKAGIGYSQLNKFLINFGINHPNILGTGNAIGLSLMHSRPSTILNFSYYNPYSTKSGIGRNISFYVSRFNAKKVNITTYATNTYGLDLGYNIRISRDDSLYFGLGYENNLLTIGKFPSQELQTFVSKYGRHFYHLKLNGGWSHRGFDRSIFPNKGLTQSLSGLVSIPIDKNSLEYYRLNYSVIYYHPIYRKFIYQLHGNVNYGNGYGKYNSLPFFKHFYAGGIGSVRGYTGNTLGPKDTNMDPLGGNFELNGTIGLIFPNPISENLRTTAFIDGGNVYNEKDIAFNELRYSAGIQFDWLSPIGVLNFSFAKPLNAKPGDEREVFQFTIGTTF